MQIWFTADLNIGHPTLSAANGEGGNAQFVRKWNEAVNPGDKVYVVGGYVCGRVEQNLAFTDYLNGDITLIAGPRDRCWEGRAGELGSRDADVVSKWAARYESAGVSVVGHSPTMNPYSVRVGKDLVGLHPLPYLDDADTMQSGWEWAPHDRGGLLVHGGGSVRGDREFNVNFRHWSRPVSLTSLRALLEGRAVQV